MGVTSSIEKALQSAIEGIHTKTYRKKPIANPVFPYIVINLDSGTPTSPSTDYYLNINIFDDPNVVPDTIMDLGDEIVEAFDCRVQISDTWNIHSVLEQRQFVTNTDLINAQMVNLRFVIRAYQI